MANAIETHGLTKDYGAGRGLFDLELTVRTGEVLGYLGPNGAGKTTTIRLLMDMIRPTRGSAFIFGLDCHAQSAEAKRLIGYLPGELPQFGGLKGTEIVTYLGGLRGGLDRRFVAEIAERFDLDLGRRFREYSRGNKQKLAILLAFMHRPHLLLVDEPTAGLDPLNQQEFYRLVRDARDDGATVFLSSHVLSEVEHVCDRVGIIRSGRLVQLTGLEQLHRIRVHHVEIEFEGAPPRSLDGVAEVDDVHLQDGRLSCTVRGNFEPLLSALQGVRVVNLVSHEPSLEDVFLTYYREEEGLPAPVP
jgi:ABC-2 type transport system ATP-binding protein